MSIYGVAKFVYCDVVSVSSRHRLIVGCITFWITRQWMAGSGLTMGLEAPGTPIGLDGMWLLLCSRCLSDYWLSGTIGSLALLPYPVAL